MKKVFSQGLPTTGHRYKVTSIAKEKMKRAIDLAGSEGQIICPTFEDRNVILSLSNNSGVKIKDPMTVEEYSLKKGLEFGGVVVLYEPAVVARMIFREKYNKTVKWV